MSNISSIESKHQIRLMSIVAASTVATICYSDRGKPPSFQEIIIIAEMIEDWVNKAK